MGNLWQLVYRIALHMRVRMIAADLETPIFVFHPDRGARAHIYGGGYVQES